MITGSHVGHGSITGAIVVDESLPVVVSQILPDTGKSVNSWTNRPGGRVVMVLVTLADGGRVSGPMVSAEQNLWCS